MQWRACIILGLLLCYHQGSVQGVSLFNFWSHILPGSSQKNVDQNSVSTSGEEYDNATTPIPITSREGGLVDFSSEESSPKITELLNPMTWFKKTKKVNTFEINAELGTVRV